MLFLVLGCLCLALVSSQSMTPEDAKAILDKHNEYRRRESSANMYLLHWNITLQERADGWAQRCLFKHERNLDIGENLFFDTDHENGVFLRGLKMWHDEKNDWRYTSRGCTRTCHYTQMVNSYTTTIGCSANVCPSLQARSQSFQNAMYLVCYYYPRGNIVGHFPFVRGAPCSQCAQGDTCTNQLCVSSSKESKTAPAFIKSLRPIKPFSPHRPIKALPAFKALIQTFVNRQTQASPLTSGSNRHQQNSRHRVSLPGTPNEVDVTQYIEPVPQPLFQTSQGKEKERLEMERREKERLEIERREKERLEIERREKERLEMERREKERLEIERRGKIRLEIERREKERLEMERREKERLEMERREKERLEIERREKERLEMERREKERLEIERRENELLEMERRKKERLERERREKERLEIKHREKERLEIERQEKERLEMERREKERLEIERREKERLEIERREKELLEMERREKERLEMEHREKERLEIEHREKERLEIERQEKERLEMERREKERLEIERREKERLKMERREKERFKNENKEIGRQELEHQENGRQYRNKQDKVQLSQQQFVRESKEKELLENMLLTNEIDPSKTRIEQGRGDVSNHNHSENTFGSHSETLKNDRHPHRDQISTNQIDISQDVGFLTQFTGTTSRSQNSHSNSPKSTYVNYITRQYGLPHTTLKPQPSYRNLKTTFSAYSKGTTITITPALTTKKSYSQTANYGNKTKDKRLLSNGIYEEKNKVSTTSANSGRAISSSNKHDTKSSSSHALPSYTNQNTRRINNAHNAVLPLTPRKTHGSDLGNARPNFIATIVKIKQRIPNERVYLNSSINTLATRNGKKAETTNNSIKGGNPKLSNYVARRSNGTVNYLAPNGRLRYKMSRKAIKRAERRRRRVRKQRMARLKNRTHPQKKKFVIDHTGRRCVDRLSRCHTWVDKCHKSGVVSLLCPLSCGKCGQHVNISAMLRDASVHDSTLFLNSHHRSTAGQKRQLKKKNKIMSNEISQPQALTFEQAHLRDKPSKKRKNRRQRQRSRKERKNRRKNKGLKRRHRQSRNGLCRDDPNYIRTCRFWAKRGFCQDNFILKTIYCRWTCGEC